MLPKSKRLTKEDFNGLRPKVFFRGELFDIAFTTVTSKKFACVISKKTLKRAVDRNLIKRRTFAVIGTMSVPTDKSFIIYPKKTTLSASYSQLEKEIQQAFATLQ